MSFLEPVPIAISTHEFDRLNSLTSRPENSIMINFSQASPHGHDNSNLPSGVLPDQHAPMDPTVDPYWNMAPNEPFMGACDECCMMCFREHGTSVRDHHRRSTLRQPCFYKTVSDHCVEGGPSCWMQVPSAFVRKYMPHVRRMRMVLENADGKPWPVVYMAEHGFFTGWAEFSTANNLALGDTLFFSFVEEAKFVVRVFGNSGCEKRVPTETTHANPTRRQHSPVATETQSANPVSSPPSKSYAPGFTRSSRPDSEFGGWSKGRGDWDGFRAPASLSNGGTYESADGNTTPQADRPTPDWIGRQIMDSQGRPSMSEIYKFQSLSAPAPRHNVPTPSWHGEAGPSTDLNLGPQGGPKSGGKNSPAWGQTWSQKQARALVTKARLRKMNIAPMPMSKLPGILKSTRSSAKKRSFVESLESDDEIGFDAGSNYDSERGHGTRGRRSFSKDGAFVSSLDSLRWDDEEAAADLRAFAEYGMNGPTSGQFQGGPSHHREMENPLDDIPEYVPQYVPEYVQQPRKPGRPRKYPPATMPQQPRRTVLPESSDGGQAMEVTEKRKRGRPFKHQVPGSSDLNMKPLRDIFVSRRRKVTQAEREVALNSAYKHASHLKASTTFIVVMRQSFVYRNFVLGVPRRFANRYMPDTNRDVTMVDESWNAWYCAWNAGYKYISGRGWRNFALEHCVEEDDALLMEILDESEISLTIKVHIFRVVPIPEGLTGWQSHVCPANTYCEPNSGIPIEPILRPPGKIQPRLQRPRECNRKKALGKRVKREPVYTEDSFTTSDSSEELD